MMSTCLSYIALNYTSASSFQMLRGSVMVFTALLSVAFLRKKLTWKHWLGIVAVVAGLAVVGVSDILFSKHPEGSHTNTQKIAGDALILVGMLFTSFQVVYEERYIGKYNIPPLQAVGWEGIFGFCTLGLLLIPFYFIIVPTSNTGPDHRLEDVHSAFCQMSGNWRIILATVGNILSIAFFNFAGISVTKELSATTRMVLDSGRTLIIWIVSLALQWQSFFPLQIVGFALLVIGMGIYNGVWEHLIRRFISSPPISSERSQLLPSHDDVSIYQSTAPSVPPISNAIST
jgi:drug/metabolite transporter (DMT)-like permease